MQTRGNMLNQVFRMFNCRARPEERQEEYDLLINPSEPDFFEDATIHNKISENFPDEKPVLLEQTSEPQTTNTNNSIAEEDTNSSINFATDCAEIYTEVAQCDNVVCCTCLCVMGFCICGGLTAGCLALSAVKAPIIIALHRRLNHADDNGGDESGTDDGITLRRSGVCSIAGILCWGKALNAQHKTCPSK